MPARTIIRVFKTIAIAMVLVFVCDIAIYLYKAFQLQQRIESLAVSLQRTVMQNNYLPESEHATYSALFEHTVQTLNGTNKANDTHHRWGRELNDNESFIQTNGNPANGIRMNYDTNIHNHSGLVEGVDGASKITVNGETVFDPNNERCVNLATPAEYGDLKYIQISVTLIQPYWGFTNQLDSNSWGIIDHPTTTMYFSYLVPCLHYNAIT